MEMEHKTYGVPEHLGGHLYKTHVDSGVLEFVKKSYDICSMVDIGCGTGDMKQVANELDIDWLGIDGDLTVLHWAKKHVGEYEPEDKFLPDRVHHDYTTGPWPYDIADGRHWDLGWSVEFLEHVEEKYIRNYMETFKRCKYIVCTAAPPDATGGHHHVNCQDLRYWRRIFTKYNFSYDWHMTEQIKEKSAMRKPFMQNHGMFFINLLRML